MDDTTPPRPADAGLWQIMAQAARNAPRWGKVTILGLVALVIAITVVSAAGLVRSEGPGVRLQLLSVVIAHAGLLMLGTAIFLHQLTQRPQTWRALLGRPLNVRSIRLHGLLIALPLAAFVAGCLLAASTALLIPTMTTPTGRPFILIGALYATVVLVAGNTVRETTRFLYRHARDQAEAAAVARSEAADARLAALQAQMNPHFLFNALNTVASLIGHEPTRAERTVEHLSHVLRRTLDRSRRTFSTLDEEIDYLRAYLAIERERYGTRLEVIWEIDPATRHTRLPPMTLQPLVENALKYAVAGRLDGATVTISAQRTNGTVTLSVHDTGPGFAESYDPGTGLSNLGSRLSTLYGTDASLEIHSHPGNTRVTVTLPEHSPNL